MHDEAASWTLQSFLTSVYFYWNKMVGVDKSKDSSKPYPFKYHILSDLHITESM